MSELVRQMEEELAICEDMTKDLINEMRQRSGLRAWYLLKTANRQVLSISFSARTQIRDMNGLHHNNDPELFVDYKAERIAEVAHEAGRVIIDQLFGYSQHRNILRTDHGRQQPYNFIKDWSQDYADRLSQAIQLGLSSEQETE